MSTRNRKKIQAPTTHEPIPPTLIAYHVAERGGKHFWTRVGAAWDHEDQKGLTIQLDLMPVSDNRIVLRKPSEQVATAGEKGA